MKTISDTLGYDPLLQSNVMGPASCDIVIGVDESSHKQWMDKRSEAHRVICVFFDDKVRGHPDDVPLLHSFGEHGLISAVTPCLGGHIFSHELTNLQPGNPLSEKSIGLIHNSLTVMGNSPQDAEVGMIYAIGNADVFLRTPLLTELMGFTDAPMICCGSGPSLSSYIRNIKRLWESERVLIMSATSTAPVLCSHGIYPHFIAVKERGQTPELVELQSWVAKEPRWKPLFVACPFIHPANFVANPMGIIGFPDATFPTEWYYCHDVDYMSVTGLTSGVMAYKAARALTVGDVFLVGHDLVRQGKRSHVEGTNYTEDYFQTTGERSVSTAFDERMVLCYDGKERSSMTAWVEAASELSITAKLNGLRGRKTFSISDGSTAAIQGVECLKYLPRPQDLRNDKVDKITLDARDYRKQFYPKLKSIIASLDSGDFENPLSAPCFEYIFRVLDTAERALKCYDIRHKHNRPPNFWREILHESCHDFAKTADMMKMWGNAVLKKWEGEKIV